MLIGGLQPVTLLDYPKKVAAIIFTSGCNMRCPFCYNPNLVLPKLIKKEKMFSPEDIFDFLQKRKKYLDGVVITGGEPTIQKDLFEFLEKIKALGYLIKLDTNGLRPNILKKLIEAKLVDYIAMDIKGPISQLKKFAGVNAVGDKIKESIKLIKVSGLPYEFRSTLVKGLHTKNDIEKMARLIKGAEKYFLQNFSSEEALVGGGKNLLSFTRKEMEEMRDVARELVKNCVCR